MATGDRCSRDGCAFIDGHMGNHGDVATDTWLAGGALDVAGYLSEGFDPKQVAQINARVSALPSERLALRGLMDGLQAASWRSIVAREGTIGGVRLG